MYDDNWPPDYDSKRLTADNTPPNDNKSPYTYIQTEDECVSYVSDEEWSEIYG